MFADLHIHTDYSDGIHSPESIIKKSLKANFTKIAITDHDIFLGNIEASKIVKERDYDLEIIQGVEFSSFMTGKEIHIIGLFVDFNNLHISKLVDDMQNKRKNTVKIIINHLNKQKIKISYDEVLSLAKGSIGRPHIAHVLINNGYASSVNDAFDRFISSEILGKIREPRLGIKEAIEVIKSAGGISIYAHPNINTKTFFNDLRELKTMGLNGIEVSSPRYGLSRQKELLEISKKLKLINSGGSDFHGFHKGIEIDSNNGINQKEYEKLLRSLN